MNGANGGNATASAGGVGGVAVSTAPVITTGYASWFSYTGGAGTSGGANSAPASVGIMNLTGYNASTLLGCGQLIGTTGGGNVYATRTTYFGGGLYYLFYALRTRV